VEPQRAAIEQRGLSLRLEVERDVPVRADAEQIARVFDNLIGNAIRFTPPGGAITASVRADGGGGGSSGSAGGPVHFVVADTGSGIPESVQHRVFERFFRAPG